MNVFNLNTFESIFPYFFILKTSQSRKLIAAKVSNFTANNETSFLKQGRGGPFQTMHVMRKPVMTPRLNQRTNRPVNAHLISGPRIGTKYTKPKTQGQEMTLTFNTKLRSFTEFVVCIYKFSGNWLQLFLKYPLFFP